MQRRPRRPRVAALVAATFAGMSIRKFAGEDGQEPFLDWVSQKPKGYVLNTDAGLSDRGSTRLHRASCFTLEPGFGGGDRQTVDYIKVCSPEPKELNEWAVGEPRLRAAQPALPALRAELARAHRLTRGRRARTAASRSGRPDALLRPAPLGTGLAGFLASGSSKP